MKNKPCFLTLLFFIILFCLVMDARATLNSSLLSYWDGTLNAGNPVDLKGVNTLTGSGLTNIAGIRGNGFEYNGADYAYKAIQPAQTSFSLCMWAKSDVAQTNGDYNILFRWGTVDGTPPEIMRVYWSGYTDNDVLRLSTYIGAGTISNCDYTNSINTAPHFYCFVVNDTDKATYYYLNGTKQGECSHASGASIDTSSQNFVIGSRYPGGDENFDGWIDEVGIYMGLVLTEEDINDLYNNTKACNPVISTCGEIPPAPAVDNRFKIGANILNFNATVNGTKYTGTNGTINTNLNKSYVPALIRITANSTNYVPITRNNYNFSTNLSLSFVPVGINAVVYTGFVNLSGVEYARNLSYFINYTCWDGSNTNIVLYINNTPTVNRAASCTNTSQTLTGTYRHGYEGNYIIKFLYNSTYGSQAATTPHTFKSDLNNPQVIEYTAELVSEGFVLPTLNITYMCNDTIQEQLVYTTYINGALLENNTRPRLTYLSNTTTSLINGINNITVQCYDYFGIDSYQDLKNIEIRTLYIIDEQKNQNFSIYNLSSVIVYLDDNRTSYNFKTENKTSITFAATANVKLRFELIYYDGLIILRYVDTGLLSDDIRVCANTEGITHYEQILTSTAIRPVILKSVFADCVVAADYTRFAYQESKVLKAYTYNNLYYLYTFEDNDITAAQVLLASVDGSIATYINLDSLEFIERGYNINTVGDTLAVKKRNANETEIYYYNIFQDNTALRLSIERLDTGQTLLNTTTFTDYNEGRVIFNFNTLTPAVNKTTLFRVTTIATDSGGTIKTTVKYFNSNGITGFLNPTMVTIISIIFLIFGLSFTVSQRTFAYFGIFIILANIAFLSLASAIWYITFMQAVNVIILLFTILVLVGKNQAQIG